MREIKYLFIRGLKQSLRPVPALIPSLFMPAFFLIIFSAAFTSLINLPGFSGKSYLVFYAPVAILQAIFFSSGDAGIDLVVDITSGYFDKLLIAPIRHVSIIIGKLIGVGLRAAVQAGIVILIILLMGGKIVTGLPGLLVILLLGGLFGMAWSGIGMTIALLTKNQRATQSSFILFFPFTFITTAQLPLSLLSGWYKTAVQLNPVTYILEAFRSLTSNGWQTHTIWVGFMVAAGVAVLTIGSTLLSFRKTVS
ncbi:ABC transporter permease [Patescibacteria group bacterium]|nr:ABC transporter permease [Patescibacteria group bacterium]